MQYDSWFYKKGKGAGVKDWIPRTDKDYFPSGAQDRLNFEKKNKNRFLRTFVSICHFEIGQNFKGFDKGFFEIISTMFQDINPDYVNSF